jgi:hypothetical protein
MDLALPQMSTFKTAKHSRIPYLIRLVGVLLLFIFVGRVGLVSVYGFAGVPKDRISRIHSEAGEQEDTDQKENNVYADKQFKCFAPQGYSQPVITAVFTRLPVYAVISADAITTAYLKVITPPPDL